MNSIFATPTKRLWVATLMWLGFWLLYGLIRYGAITGPNAFHWITGAMNYPGAITVFIISDWLLSKKIASSTLLFLLCSTIAVATVPLYFHRLGFTLGVFVDAYFS